MRLVGLFRSASKQINTSFNFNKKPSICSFSHQCLHSKRITVPAGCHSASWLRFDYEVVGSQRSRMLLKTSSCQPGISLCAVKRMSDSTKSKHRNAEIDSMEKEIDENEDYKRLNVFMKFKYLAKKYWFVIIPVHAVLSIFWFGLFWTISFCGLDVLGLVTQLVEYFDFGYFVLEQMKNTPSHAHHLVSAYALYKITALLRYAVTIAGTTFLIRRLSKSGYIKSLPTREQLKNIIAKTKDRLS